jgi:Na+/proline symporter
MSETINIEIKKRPWYEWLLWALWLFAEIFLLQNAITSRAELEPRAATIFWVLFFILLIAGGVIWFMRRDQ